MTTYDFIAANKRRSVLLIAVFMAFVMALCWFLDQYYRSGGLFLVIGLVYSLGSALVGYYAGDKLALASSGAREVAEKDNPYVVRMVQNLCITTGTTTPRVYIIQDDAINAFACGRDPAHASIAVTTGAIRKLENEELEGVLAHELSHVRNYDIRVMTLVIVLVGVVSVIADLAMRMSLFGRGSRDREEGNGPLAIIGIVLIILSPIIAAMVQMAVSRRREYLADASAALITRFPEGLARALAKIQRDNRPMASASTATSHLFIANPLAGGYAAIFSTHPPIEKRIEALMKMANTHE
jgi:heat shock protein HtpX